MEQDTPQLETIGKATKNFPLKFNVITREMEMDESIKDDDRILLMKENGIWMVYKVI